LPFHQRFPRLNQPPLGLLRRGERPEQQQLQPSPRFSPGIETGRNNAGVVEDQQVGRGEIFGQRRKGAVLDSPALPVIDQQPRRVPLGGRVRRDQRRIEKIIECRKREIVFQSRYFTSS